MKGKVIMKVITFGELMLRLAPEGYYRFTQVDKFGATFGGGEANVAVSLANYGINVAFVSKIVNNPIGDAAVNSLRKYGVDTSLITRGGDRMGIYYLEKGASQRPSKRVQIHNSIYHPRPWRRSKRSRPCCSNVCRSNRRNRYGKRNLLRSMASIYMGIA